MDNYITDDSIVQLVDLGFKSKEGQTFYDAFPNARDAVFVPPYPEMACTKLGYPRIVVKQEKESEVSSAPDTEAQQHHRGGTSNDPISLSSDDENTDVGENNKVQVDDEVAEVAKKLHDSDDESHQQIETKEV